MHAGGVLEGCGDDHDERLGGGLCEGGKGVGGEEIEGGRDLLRDSFIDAGYMFLLRFGLLGVGERGRGGRKSELDATFGFPFRSF